MEDLNLRQLVSNIKSLHANKALEQKTELKVLVDEDIPEYIIGDQVRIGQILNNLISNAIKFTFRGKIKIELVSLEKTDTKVTIDFVVSDTGIGIEPDKINVIFERFTQANTDTSRKYGGTGLGLAITKRLLNLMGSEISVESELGKGTTFKFSLAFNYNLNVAINVEEDKNFGNEVLIKRKVLLVEDSEFNVIVAKKFLESWGMTVDIAINGQIAIDKVRLHKYDIILMDVEMPEMDGFEASSVIRKFDMDTPILALTAYSASNVMDKIKECGMNDIVVKPFDPASFKKRLIKYVGQPDLPILV